MRAESSTRPSLTRSVRGMQLFRAHRTHVPPVARRPDGEHMSTDHRYPDGIRRVEATVTAPSTRVDGRMRNRSSGLLRGVVGYASSRLEWSGAGSPQYIRPGIIVYVDNDSGAAPESLYFYTDAFGLQGILSPASWPIRWQVPADQATRYRNPDDYHFGRAALLMSSDVRYMNDTSELRFGAEIVRDRLEAACTNTALDSDLRSAFGQSAATFHANSLHKWPWQCFASCFCVDGDLLSQWRGYAGGTGGFAIGFSTDGLSLDLSPR